MGIHLCVLDTFKRKEVKSAYAVSSSQAILDRLDAWRQSDFAFATRSRHYYIGETCLIRPESRRFHYEKPACVQRKPFLLLPFFQ